MPPCFGLLFGLIAFALIFDFLNGLHDAANSIATIVSTRVLPPRAAVLWAAFFNFIAFLFFGLHVAQTIGTGIRSRPTWSPACNLCRTDGRHRLELDHLVGRNSLQQLACADRWAAGGRHRQGRAQRHRLARCSQDGRRHRSFAGRRVRPGPGAGVWLCRGPVLRSTPYAVDRTFRLLQFGSASLYSLGHGGNDAQKTMGIIAGLLFAAGTSGCRSSMCRSGWSSAVRRQWRWARCSAAGASSRQWDRRSPG